MLYHDHYQNFRQYNMPRAQLVIADIPYNIGKNAYASNPAWYVDGDNENGESDLAGKSFFDTDENFKPPEFMHFCSKMMKPEPKERNDAPCMFVFCSYWQQHLIIELAKEHGINNYINVVFRKNYSAQVLKANMRIVGNAEYGLVLYREKLPKFRNNGKMIFNVMDWIDDKDDGIYRKIHPNQKPVKLLEKIISIFTDPGDVVIDPVAGSGATLVAAENIGRKAYGFEIKKNFHKDASDWIAFNKQVRGEISSIGYSETLMQKQHPNQISIFA